MSDRERPHGEQWRPDYTDASGRQADPYEIVDAILGALESHGYDIDEDSYRESLKALDWRDRGDRNAVRERFQDGGGYNEPILPGFGPDGHAETARDDCGDPHPFLCDCCGRHVDFGRTCGQSVCVRCALVWNRDLAASKASKMRRLRIEKQKETPGQGRDGEWQKFHHLAISAPLGWYRDLAAAGLSLEEAQDVTKDVVKSILAELRAQGVLVRHSYRGADGDGGLRDELDDRGLWKERLYSERDWYGDVRGQLAWKPHYHALVVADRVHVTNEADDPSHRPNLSTVVERETGWSIHRIESRDGKRSVENDGSMARVLTYMLSHGDLRQNVGAQNHTRSQSWTVGRFHGKTVASHEDFVATDSDEEWAEAAVRNAAEEVLGLHSASTNCGAALPGVDDPDELARRIIEDLYPGDDRDVPEDVVLHHVAEGNIRVNVSTTDGGGGDVTVTDAFGEPIRGDGFSGGSLPEPSGSRAAGGAEVPPAVDGLQEDSDDDLDADHADGSSSSGTDECDGSMIPLGEARERGLLDDDEWCKQAPHVDEAREADREHPEDLPAWNVAAPPEHGPSIGG